nr:immunoglobulin light chain junction region [Macaca mulatta]
CLQYYSDPLIF